MTFYLRSNYTSITTKLPRHISIQASQVNIGWPSKSKFVPPSSVTRLALELSDSDILLLHPLKPTTGRAGAGP